MQSGCIMYFILISLYCVRMGGTMGVVQYDKEKEILPSYQKHIPSLGVLMVVQSAVPLWGSKTPHRGSVGLRSGGYINEYENDIKW